MAEQTSEAIRNLLETAPDNVALVQGLQQLALTDSEGVRKADHLWAIPLFQRDSYFFEQFIIERIAQPETINALLPLIEEKQRDSLFQALYKRVASESRWQSDVNSLLTASDTNVISWGLRVRSGQWATTPLELLMRIYQHNADLQIHVIGHVLHGGNTLRIEPKTGRAFFETIRNSALDPMLYWALFRKFATYNEWLSAVQDLLTQDIKAEDLGKRLQEIGVLGKRSYADADIAYNNVSNQRAPKERGLSIQLANALLAKYDTPIMLNFVEQHCAEYVRRLIQSVLEEPDDAVLFDKLLNLHKKKRHLLGTTDDLWAPVLYDRNPTLLEENTVFFQAMNDEVRQTLLKRAQQDKHIELFRKLYKMTARKEQWNADLLDLARSNLPAGAIDKELVRFDTHNQWITDETAAALYSRDPDLFRKFIKDRLITPYSSLKDTFKPYLLLLEAARQANDAEFADWLFRRMITNEQWQALMEALLAQDIPADAIVSELEKINPLYPKNIQPEILARFLAKYGEVVLPFFERYINWCTRPRIQSLLDLNLDRGELLRELQIIATRQPDGLAAIADVWAMRLYELGPSFFSSFLIRNLGRTNTYAIRALLPRVEADGRLDMFQDLYQRVIRNEEWLQDIKRLAQSDLPDAELARKIKMRDFGVNPRLGRYQLNDEVAVLVYQRNPVQFRNFVKRQVRPQSRYPKLLAALLANADTELYEALFRHLDFSAYWQREMRRILDQNLPESEALAAFKALDDPQHWYRIDDWSILVEFIERYGQAMMPFALRHVQASSKKENVLYDYIQKVGSERDKWRAFFMLGRNDNSHQTWRAAILDAAAHAMSEAEFSNRLSLLRPPGEHYRTWKLAAETLTILYKKYPRVTPAFIRDCLDTSTPELFAAVEEQRDEKLLDWLSYRHIQQIFSLIPHVEAEVSRYTYDKKDALAMKENLDALARSVTARLDRLAQEGAEQYTTHVNAILGHWETMPFSQELFQYVPYHPIFQYFLKQHHTAWLEKPQRMRDLLESPEEMIQDTGLRLLDSFEESSAWNDLIVANLPLLRLVLLTRTRRFVKKRVLRMLLRVARTQREAVIHLIEECMEYYGFLALADEMMVAYARLTHAEQVGG